MKAMIFDEKRRVVGKRNVNDLHKRYDIVTNEVFTFGYVTYKKKIVTVKFDILEKYGSMINDRSLTINYTKID